MLLYLVSFDNFVTFDLSYKPKVFLREFSSYPGLSVIYKLISLQVQSRILLSNLLHFAVKLVHRPEEYRNRIPRKSPRKSKLHGEI